MPSAPPTSHRIDEVTAVILIVMTNPRHRVRQCVFVPSLRHQIKKVVRAD